MAKKYDFTQKPFSGIFADDEEAGIKLTFDAQSTEVANVVVSLRLGSLAPSAAKEIFDFCDMEHADESAFKADLAQYYFDCTGNDIADAYPFFEGIEALCQILKSGTATDAQIVARLREVLEVAEG